MYQLNLNHRFETFDDPNGYSYKGAKTGSIIRSNSDVLWNTKAGYPSGNEDYKHIHIHIGKSMWMNGNSWGVIRIACQKFA